jgi:hypothetical protein
MKARKTTKSKPVKEPDWKEIVRVLGGDILFAITNFKLQGMGQIYNSETGELRHWKESFADHLEMIPGWKIDREVMHANDLPKKERAKFFKDRETKTKP